MRPVSAAPWLALLLLALPACDEPTSGAAPPSRVVAVGASTQGPDLDAFCEVRPRRPLSLPELADGAAADSPRWVNVWATWCRPCVEELPMIARWQTRLGGESGPSVLLLSADQEPEALSRFVGEHPAAEGSVRLADPSAVAPWLVTLGLDEGAPLPVHLFLDDTGRVTCARTGALGERDYAAVAALIGD